MQMDTNNCIIVLYNLYKLVLSEQWGIREDSFFQYYPVSPYIHFDS